MNYNYILAVIAVVALLGIAYFAGYLGPGTAVQQVPTQMATSTQAATSSLGTSGASRTQTVSHGTSATTTTTANCHLALTTSGGLFAPTACTFEEAVSGAQCKQGTCPPTYALRLRDMVKGRIQTVALSPTSRASGTYTYNKGGNNLTGTLVDAQSLSWTLSSGTMTLSPAAGDTEGIVFDASFTNGFKVSGTGTLQVTRISAQ